MAKKKVGKKNAAKRMGATSLLNPANPMLLYGSIALGYFVVGSKINDMIDQAAGDKIDGKIIAAGEVGLGYLLAKNKKKSLLTTVGGGIVIGAGIKRALTSFGIGGFYNVPGVAGFYDVKAVNRAKRLGAYTPGGGGMSYNSRSAMNGSGGLMNSGGSSYMQ
jgi:hypothetical protein